MFDKGTTRLYACYKYVHYPMLHSSFLKSGGTLLNSAGRIPLRMRRMR